MRRLSGRGLPHSRRQATPNRPGTRPADAPVLGAQQKPLAPLLSISTFSSAPRSRTTSAHSSLSPLASNRTRKLAEEGHPSCSHTAVPAMTKVSGIIVSKAAGFWPPLPTEHRSTPARKTKPAAGTVGAPRPVVVGWLWFACRSIAPSPAARCSTPARQGSRTGRGRRVRRSTPPGRTAPAPRAPAPVRSPGGTRCRATSL